MVLALAALASMGEAGTHLLRSFNIPESWDGYLRLAGFIGGVVGFAGAHYGTSPLPGQHDAETVSPRADAR